MLRSPLSVILHKVNIENFENLCQRISLSTPNVNYRPVRLVVNNKFLQSKGIKDIREVKYLALLDYYCDSSLSILTPE